MKKSILIFSIVIYTYIPLMASINNVLIDDIYYNLNIGLRTAMVTNNGNSSSYSGDVVIPSQIVYDHIKYQVTSIGDNAFSGCEKLTSVVLPTSLKRIGRYAFSECTSITSVTIPYGVESIEECAFDRCYKLVSLDISGSVKTIGGRAFQYCDLKTVIIPEGVTFIGGSAFRYNFNLQTISIPNSLTQLGYYSFHDTKWLEQAQTRSMDTGRVYLGNWFYSWFNTGGYGNIDIKEGCVGIVDGAFGRELESITLPSSLLYIGEAAFRYSKLTSINIPNNVTTIYGSAFERCDNLSSIHIGNNVYKIGKDAFTGTPWLESQPNGVVYVGNVAYTYKYNYWEEPSESLILKEGCLGIADGFFNAYIESITIPSTLKYIGDQGWFVNRMSSIIVEDGNTVYNSLDNCNAIIETATNTLLLGCKNTIIPNNVITIGRLAMANNELVNITIPNNVKEIRERAFENTALKSIRIPNSIIEIEQGAFGENEELEVITIDKENVVYDSRESCNAIIETYTNTLIEGCKKTFVPSSIAAIENLSCDGIQDLYCYAETVPVANISFPYATILHVPAKSVEDYKATAPWNQFKDVVAIGSESAINSAIDEQQSPIIWYDLNGNRLIEKPNIKGVYINRTSKGRCQIVIIN